EVGRCELAFANQSAVCSHILHPNCSAFFERKVSWVLGYSNGRNDCDLSVNAILVGRESRNGADSFSQPGAIDLWADSLNDPRSFIADFRREYWREAIPALTEVYFRAIETNGFYTESDLTVVRRRKRKFIELKNLRGPNLVKADYLRPFRTQTIPRS